MGLVRKQERFAVSGGSATHLSPQYSMARPVVFHDLPTIVKMVDRRGPGLRIDHVPME